MEDDVSGTSPRRHLLGSLVPLVVFSLVAGLLSANPAVAHTFTKADGNDSPGRLDLRSVTVSHTATGIVHKVTTYNSWTSRSLGANSFFIIQIDKNHDQRYERCAFIYFASRLRGSLTNCGAQFIRSLPVSKVSGTTAKITIPKSQTGTVYWWAAASLWDGPAPCGHGCVDFAPNNFPDILHDMISPVVTQLTDPLREWVDSTTLGFTFPFSVSDAHSGIQSWTVQRYTVDTATWSNVISGSTGGSKDAPVVGEEGTRVDYRVVAKDKQGNKRIGPTRRVYIPRDDDSLDPEGVFSATPTNVPDDPTAFGGSYSRMAATDTLTYTLTPGTDCLFELIGPGDGTWAIEVSADGGPVTPVADTDIDDLPRQTLYTDSSCATSYVVTVNSGMFGLDAVLG
jgi:hypothetical protein